MCRDGEVVKQELVTKGVIEWKAAKDNDTEGYPVVGAPLVSRAARLSWSVSATRHDDFVKEKRRALFVH